MELGARTPLHCCADCRVFAVSEVLAPTLRPGGDLLLVRCFAPVRSLAPLTARARPTPFCDVRQPVSPGDTGNSCQRALQPQRAFPTFFVTPDCSYVTRRTSHVSRARKRRHSTTPHPAREDLARNDLVRGPPADRDLARELLPARVTTAIPCRPILDDALEETLHQSARPALLVPVEQAATLRAVNRYRTAFGHRRIVARSP